MKKSLLIICVSLVGCFVFANTSQQGIVKTKGRLNEDQTITKGTPLSDAYVTVQGAQTVSSNKKGLFSVALTSKDYYLKDVNKEGYVLCDADILSRPYAYSPNPLYIVMETPAQQMEDKIFAERKLRRTLQRQLIQREDEIDSLKTRQQISEEEYRQQLQQIYSDQKENERLIAEMAERYASIDYDQLDEFNRQISALILEGKLTEADSLIRTKGDIASRIESLKEHQEKNQQEEQALKKRMKALEKSKAYTQKELEDLAQDCYSLFEIFKMQHKNDSAAYYLELRASLDTTNVEWMIEAGNFVQDYIADYKQSMNYYQKAIEKALSKGEQSAIVATCYECIGSLHSLLGQRDDALEFLSKSLKLKEALYGNNHLEIAKSYSNIGMTYFDMGMYDNAMDYYNKCLFIRKNNNSSTILDLINVEDKIASLLRELGKYQEALNKFEDIVSILEKMDINEVGDDLAREYNNLGHIYYVNADYDMAKQLYEKALKIWVEIYGEQHPNLAMLYNNMGALYSRLGEYANALHYEQKAIEIGEKAFGESSPNLIAFYVTLGSAHEQMGQYSKALGCYEIALDICSVMNGEEHPTMAVIYNNIGAVFSNVKMYESALKYYQKALAIQKKIYGEEVNADIAKTYGNLGVLYADMKEYVLALENITISKQMNQKLLGENHPSLGVDYQNIASIYADMGESAKAREYYRKAEDIYKSNFGEIHPRVAGLYNSMGTQYYRVKRYRESLDCYHKSVNMRIQIYGDTSTIVAETYMNMSNVFYTLQTLDSTLYYLEKVFAIKRPILGEDHAEMQNLYTGMYLCLSQRPELRTQERLDFFRHKMALSGFIQSEDTPAGQQGMSGLYFILEYGDWRYDVNDVFDFYTEAARMNDLPKDLLVYQDGVISMHHFEGKMGIRFGVNYVGEPTRDEILQAYTSWKEKDGQ